MADIFYQIGDNERTRTAFNDVTVKGLTKEQWIERKHPHTWEGHPKREEALSAVYDRCVKSLGIEAPASIVPPAAKDEKAVTTKKK